MSDWSMAELEALERGAPISVVGEIRARREVRAAAGLLDPADVNFGMALGLERCGICRHYEPSDNPMTGGCAIVDKYRVERNNWCEAFEIADPSTSGSPGGAVARAAQEFYAMVVRPRVPTALIAANQALLGQHKLLRNRMEARYGSAAPRMFARWSGDGC